MDDNKSKGGWFLAVLALLFIAMKLMHYISWSWIWVLCPLWGPFAIGLLCAIVSFILEFVKQANKHNQEQNWMDKKENEELLHRMWTGDNSDDH